MAGLEVPADVELACRRLIVSFAHHLDHRRFRDVAALFTEDGTWLRRGESMHGPDQILAFLAQRAVTVVERHVMTTILVERLTDTTCAATSYAMIYRAAHSGDGVPTIQGLSAMGEFHDKFRLTDDGWRFTYRMSEPVFAFDDPT